LKVDQAAVCAALLPVPAGTLVVESATSAWVEGVAAAVVPVSPPPPQAASRTAAQAQDSPVSAERYDK